MTWRVVWEVETPKEEDPADAVELRYELVCLLIERARVTKDAGYWQSDKELMYYVERNPEADAETLARRLEIVYKPVFHALLCDARVKMVQHDIPPAD